jgi:hypothetical protein
VVDGDGLDEAGALLQEFMEAEFLQGAEYACRGAPAPAKRSTKSR